MILAPIPTKIYIEQRNVGYWIETATVPSIFFMKEEYDFSQSTKNPYIKKLKKQVTIRLEEEVIIYFKNLSEQTGIPYQSLINLYLQDCVKMQRKPSLEWLSNV